MHLRKLILWSVAGCAGLAIVAGAAFAAHRSTTSVTTIKAVGADPNSNAPPKFQYLEDGVGQKTPPSVDKPGDSGVTGKGKKGESINLKVTAPAGTKLYFMCLIHPWMQAEVDVT